MIYTLENFRTDLHNSKTIFINNWFHSLISSLGILIGVTSITLIISISESAQKTTLENFKTLGLNTIRVANKRVTFENTAYVEGLSQKDFKIIQSVIGSTGFSSASYEDKQIQILHKNKTFASRLIGSDQNFLLVEELHILKGRALLEDDIRTYKKHALISSSLSKKYHIEVGNVIVINNFIYKIIGIVSTKDSLKDFIVLPYNSYPFYKNVFDHITCFVKDKTVIYKKSSIIQKNLLQLHQRENFTMTIPLKLLEKEQESSRIFSIIVLSIAAISLLTGGISIMNIMLSNISEQTREIGLRFALGATKKRIMIQYLINTSFITVISGLLGTILGYFIILLIMFFSNITLFFSIKALIAALSMTFFSGLIFGIYPAKRASQIEPMIALKEL